jgi:uncharacterized membrane protein
MFLEHHRLVKKALRWSLTLFMLAAGTMHLLFPEMHRDMVPPTLPSPLVLVYLSGVAQIAGGLGLIAPATRHWAAWGIVVLLVLLFPANVHMALQHLPIGTHEIPPWALWARLPMQAVFIVWAWWYTHPDAAAD